MKYKDFLKLNEQQEESEKKWLTIDDFNKSLNDDDDEYGGGDDDAFDDYDEEYEYRVHGKSTFGKENTDQPWNSPLKDKITKEDIDIVFEDNFDLDEPLILKDDDYKKIISGYERDLYSFRTNQMNLEDAILELIDEL